MIELKDVFSYGAIQSALEHLVGKKDTAGSDGMLLSELATYLTLNPNWCQEINGDFFYECSDVREFRHLGRNKKQRLIYQFNALDRLVARSLSQLLELDLDDYLSPNCFSYRDEKGLLPAVMQMKTFIEEGREYLLELDIKDYFESISHRHLLEDLRKVGLSEEICSLIQSFLQVRIMTENGSYIKKKGVITGSSISPILSNFYLREFDAYLDGLDLSYVRYGDDYFFFFDEREVAERYFPIFEEKLEKDYQLEINRKKSGVFSPFRKKILGYYYSKTRQGILVNRPPKNLSFFDCWQDRAIDVIDYKYDIISDGILTQEHWNLLFDREDGKVHIPTEVADYLNVYSNVIIDSRVIQLLAQKKIRVNLMNTYGEKIAVIAPPHLPKNLTIMHKQVLVYHDDALRLLLAKELEKSSIHNMRSILRYYRKKEENSLLVEKIMDLTRCMQEVETVPNLNHLMMIEARARQIYFSCFNDILLEDDFHFSKRTRRPPEDALNAMISFGNVYLYNYIASMIYRSPLDIRFSFVHSANRRLENLNLDLADIFKPILIDRTIFSLINRREIQLDKHFEQVVVGDKVGVYLNREGRLIFLRALKEKLRTVITVRQKKLRYSDVIHEEVYKLCRFLRDGETYKGYRYTT